MNNDRIAYDTISPAFSASLTCTSMVPVERVAILTNRINIL